MTCRGRGFIVAAMATPVRLAIVGGRRGASFDAALRAFGDLIELTAVCDTDPAVLDRWRTERPGIAAFPSYEELLGAGSANAVLLAAAGIIIISAKKALEDRIKGLEIGSELGASLAPEFGEALGLELGSLLG